MRRRFARSAGLLAVLLAAGCGGSGKLQTKGRLLKDGAPLVPADDEIVRILFVPLPEGGARVTDFYVATFNRADGTFQAAGNDGKGVPPGKYRIAIEHLKDKKDPVEGRVVAVLRGAAGKPVVEGQPVHQGDVLVQLDATVVRNHRDKAEAAKKVLGADKAVAEFAVKLAALEVRKVNELKKQQDGR